MSRRLFGRKLNRILIGQSFNHMLIVSKRLCVCVCVFVRVFLFVCLCHSDGSRATIHHALNSFLNHVTSLIVLFLLSSLLPLITLRARTRSAPSIHLSDDECHVDLPYNVSSTHVFLITNHTQAFSPPPTSN